MEHFGIDFNFTARGVDKIQSDFMRLVNEGKKLGKSYKDISAELEKLKREYLAGAVAGSDFAKAIQQSFENAKKASNDLGSSWGQLAKTVGSIGVAFAGVKKVNAYATAIATVNYQMRMLHLSSGMGIASLQSFGSALSVTGGSAQTGANFAQRIRNQWFEARRGRGLGFINQLYQDFKFSSGNWDSHENLIRDAINHLRTGMVRPEEREVFARQIGGDDATAKYILKWAARSVEEQERFESYFKRIAETYETADGKNRAKEASDAAEKWSDSKAQLDAEWKAVQQQFMAAALPLITDINDLLSKGLQLLNENPELINIASTLASIYTMMLSLGTLKGVLGWLGKGSLISGLLRVLTGGLFGGGPGWAGLLGAIKVFSLAVAKFALVGAVFAGAFSIANFLTKKWLESQDDKLEEEKQKNFKGVMIDPEMKSLSAPKNVKKLHDQLSHQVPDWLMDSWKNMGLSQEQISKNTKAFMAREAEKAKMYEKVHSGVEAASTETVSQNIENSSQKSGGIVYNNQSQNTITLQASGDVEKDMDTVTEKVNDLGTAGFRAAVNN